MSAVVDTPGNGLDPAVHGCADGGAVTRSLLGYLAVAGPFYVVVSVAQALTRRGFDPTRHEWSLLALGPLGWIQVANLCLSGVMVVAGALGMRRVARELGRASAWPARLLVGYGLALISAGLFRADPANGFPAGTPAGRPQHVSWHGTFHIVFGSLGFACVIAACFVMAAAYARRGASRLATGSRLVGALFAAAFVGIASGGANRVVNLAFTAAVVLSSAWLTTVAADLYRGTRRHDAKERTR